MNTVNTNPFDFSSIFPSGTLVRFQRAVNSSPLTKVVGQDVITDDLQFFVLSTFKPESLKRKSEDVTHRLGLTIEFEFECPDIQIRMAKEVLGDPTVAVHSGNKSVHNHYIFTEPVEVEDYKKLAELVKEVLPMADPTVLTDVARLCRVPEAIRNIGTPNSVKQKVLSLSTKHSFSDLLKRVTQYKESLVPSIRHDYSKVNLAVYAEGMKLIQEPWMAISKFYFDKNTGSVHPSQMGTYTKEVASTRDALMALSERGLLSKEVYQDLFKSNEHTKKVLEGFSVVETLQETGVETALPNSVEDSEELRTGILQSLKDSPPDCSSFDDFIRLMLSLRGLVLNYDEVDPIFQVAGGNYNYANNEEIFNSLTPTQVSVGTAYWYANLADAEGLHSKLSTIAKEKRGTSVCKRCGKPMTWAEDHKTPLNLDGSTHKCSSKDKAKKAVSDFQAQGKNLIGFDAEGKLCPMELMQAVLSELGTIVWVEDQSRFYSYNATTGKWTDERQDVQLLFGTHIDKLLALRGRSFVNPRNQRACTFYAHQLCKTIQSEKFNHNRMYINCSNGVIDISTVVDAKDSKELANVKLLPFSPDYYQTVGVDVEFDPEAECPTWERFLGQLGHDSSTLARLQEWAGYILYPEIKIEKILYNMGDGANGKSTFIGRLEKIMGKTVVNLSISEQLERFGTLMLKDAMVNLCSEDGDDSAQRVSSSKFKKIVSGELLKAESKGEKPISFRPFCKQIMSSNNFIYSNDKSNGFFRRFDVIEWTREFSEVERDLELGFKLDKELVGIFNWMILGLGRLIRHDWKMTDSEQAKKAHEDFQEELNPLRSWLKEECIIYPFKDLKDIEDIREVASERVFNRLTTEDNQEMRPLHELTDSPVSFFRIYKDVLYTTYADWMKARGHRPYAINTFGKELKRAGVTVRRLIGKDGPGVRTRVYEGIELISRLADFSIS